MARGRLRIYLGAAPGVGKTFAMLNEGWRRHQRGTDVVVGYVETHGRPNTVAQVRDLEVTPRRTVEHRGATLEEMDVDAILARRPDVCLVDELAHTNAPGSRHAKRWQDVDDLLAAGIDVISTVNVQHLESVNDVVERITGVRQRETVPDAIVRSAEQVELVDMTPEALRRRMAHGNIYPAERVDAALGNYFRPGNLAALRELALLWVADKVEEALQSYLEDHGIEGTWETRERVVVALTGSPSGEPLVRRAARMAQRTHGDLIGVHVRADDGRAQAPVALLEAHRQLLVDLGGTYHEIVGADAARALADFARRERATQLVLGTTRRSRWDELLHGSVINEVIREVGDLDVHVIATDAVAAEDATAPDEPAQVLATRPTARRAGALPPRRRLVGWAVVLLGLPALTTLLVAVRDDVNLPTVMLLYLVLTVGVGAVGGLGPAVVAAVAASLCINWFFTPPIQTWTISDAENALALVLFVLVAVVVAGLSDRLARRGAEAGRARNEAEVLARLAASAVVGDDPLPDMLGLLRTTFALDAVAVLAPDGRSGREGRGGWSVEAAAGEPVPSAPDGHDGISLGSDEVLVCVGPPLSGDDARVLQVFSAQVAAAVDQRKLRREAAMAAARVEADEVRTAILRAVSHDLRTPLASIKASVTSLLAEDITFDADTVAEFLAVIDTESDRLDRLVGNLLDMSRIEAGALEPLLRPVGLDDVVAGAVASLSAGADRVVIDVPADLAPVRADAALLERAVANLLTNALAFAPEGADVTVDAAAVGAEVVLRIVDRGPGVAAADRHRLFEPFQRLGDAPVGAGVGLGLAVAKGCVEACGGTLGAEDTPGGGLTMVISLPVEVAGAPGGMPASERHDLTGRRS